MKVKDFKFNKDWKIVFLSEDWELYVQEWWRRDDQSYWFLEKFSKIEIKIN